MFKNMWKLFKAMLKFVGSCYNEMTTREGDHRAGFQISL